MNFKWSQLIENDTECDSIGLWIVQEFGLSLAIWFKREATVCTYRPAFENSGLLESGDVIIVMGGRPKPQWFQATKSEFNSVTKRTSSSFASPFCALFSTRSTWLAKPNLITKDLESIPLRSISAESSQISCLSQSRIPQHERVPVSYRRHHVNPIGPIQSPARYEPTFKLFRILKKYLRNSKNIHPIQVGPGLSEQSKKCLI